MEGWNPFTKEAWTKDAKDFFEKDVGGAFTDAGEAIDTTFTKTIPGAFTSPIMKNIACMATLGIVGCTPPEQYDDPNVGQQEQMIMIVILVIIGIFILVIISSLFGQSSEDKMIETMMMQQMMENM